MSGPMLKVLGDRFAWAAPVKNIKVRMGRYRATWANSGGLREVREPVNRLPTGNRLDSSSLVRIGFLPPSGNHIPAVAHEWAAIMSKSSVVEASPVKLRGRLSRQNLADIKKSKDALKELRAAMHACRHRSRSR